MAMGNNQDEKVLGERARHVVIGRDSSGSGSGMQWEQEIGQNEK